MNKENMQRIVGVLLVIRMLAGAGLALSDNSQETNLKNENGIEEVEMSGNDFLVMPKKIINEKTQKTLLELPKGYTLYQVDGEKLGLLMTLDNGDSTIFMSSSDSSFDDKGFVGVRDDLYAILKAADLTRDMAQKDNLTGSLAVFYYTAPDQTYSVAGPTSHGTMAIEPDLEKDKDRILLTLPKGWSIVYAGLTSSSPVDLELLNSQRSTIEHAGRVRYCINRSYLPECSDFEVYDCSKFIGVPDEMAKIIFAADKLKAVFADYYKNGGKLTDGLAVAPTVKNDGENGIVFSVPTGYVLYNPYGELKYEKSTESVGAVNYFGCDCSQTDQLIGLNENIAVISQNAKKLDARIKTNDYEIGEPLSYSPLANGFIVQQGYVPYYTGDEEDAIEFSDTPTLLNPSKPSVIVYAVLKINDEAKREVVKVLKSYVDVVRGAQSLMNSFQKEFAKQLHLD